MKKSCNILIQHLPLQVCCSLDKCIFADSGTCTNADSAKHLAVRILKPCKFVQPFAWKRSNFRLFWLWSPVCWCHLLLSFSILWFWVWSHWTWRGLLVTNGGWLIWFWGRWMWSRSNWTWRGLCFVALVTNGGWLIWLKLFDNFIILRLWPGFWFIQPQGETHFFLKF